jgi:hypothetical protein
MYDNFVRSVQISDSDTNDFLINIGLHQGLTLSSYLCTLVMDEVTGDRWWYPLVLVFANNVILVVESMIELDQKLEL